MKKLWFKNRSYGWGWTPASWEGWLVLAVYLFIVIGSIENIARKGALGTVVWFVFFTGLLIWITTQKGESPEWRWGKKKEVHHDVDNKKED